MCLLTSTINTSLLDFGGRVGQGEGREESSEDGNLGEVHVEMVLIWQGSQDVALKSLIDVLK
jgi:hypothetical protein